MPHYGPWITPDQYDKNGEAFGSSFTGSAETQTSDALNDPPLDAEVRSVQVLANHSATDLAGPIGVIPGGGPMRYQTSYDNGVFPPWATVIRAEMDFGPAVISPFSFGVSNWAPILLEDIPENAIGWQWQSDLSEDVGKPSEVIAAQITATLTGADLDDTVTPTATREDWGVQLIAAAATYLSDTALPSVADPDEFVTWDGPDGDLVASLSGPGETVITVEVTDYLDSLGRVTLSRQMDFGSPMVPLDVSVDDHGINYGRALAYLENAVLWTFQPPTFRWILEGPGFAPPLRRKQRDDRHGNTARNTPSSQQESNRNTGYL